MPDTDLATRDEITPETLEAREAELVAGATAGLDKRDVTLPMLSLTQQLSKAVTSGKRESGHYINSLTGRDYGAETELIVVFATQGRFYSDRKAGVFATFEDVAPKNWPPQFAGKRFDEIPEAEETFKHRANTEEGFEWGSGPPIQTTRNFVGFIPDEPDIPVRLSLKSTSTPAALRIQAILDWSLKAPWHNVIELTTSLEHDSQDNPYYVVRAEQGRVTTTEERIAAVNLSGIVQQSTLALTGDTDERAEAKAAKRESAGGSDGLAVS